MKLCWPASAWILAMSPYAWRRRNNRVTKARSPVFVWREGIRSTRQLSSHVAVRETVQGVFPRKVHLKEHALVSRQRIKGSDRPAVFGRCTGYREPQLRNTEISTSPEPLYVTATCEQCRAPLSIPGNNLCYSCAAGTD